MSFSWLCPFCGHHSTIGNDNTTSSTGHFNDGNKYGTRTVVWRAIACPNPKCRHYAFNVLIHDGSTPPKVQHSWQLVPAAKMKILPDYVPEVIVADYKEACLIADLSPKASATLSRRCLQGMIRDFWGISRPKLFQEIEAIKDKVAELDWKAIVRS